MTRHIQSTLQDILQTASFPKLALNHGAAALDALCGFLEHASASSEHQIRRLSYNTETWTQAFTIFLTQSDHNRTKPMRRLLLTLTRLISKHPIDTEKNLLLGISTCFATRAIRKQHDFASIKPAIQVLEHFLSTGLMGAAEIAQVRWPEQLGLFRTEATKTDGQNLNTQQGQISQSVQAFALSVLEWIKYPDCAPAVGRFLPVLFKSLEESQSSDAGRTPNDAATPLWISPLKQTLERYQDLFDVFETHILPGLLRLGSADVEAFLRLLPFESIQRGNIGSTSISDIQLCLLVAKTAEDPSLRKHFGQGQSTSLNLEILGTSLLVHSSSAVRLAALSLLVSSSASSRPLCRRVLRRMRQCIPHFHVEANAKPRNEFIALMKKLCMRIRGATLSLLRRHQILYNVTGEQASTAAHFFARLDDEGPVSSGKVIEQVLNEEMYILEEHLAFRKWYMVFLLQELRPTATYQSHITALKVSSFLIEQTIALRNTPSRSHNDYISALNEYLPEGLFVRPLTDLLLDPFDDVREAANRVFDLHLSINSIPQTREERDDGQELRDQEAKYETDNDDDYRKANESILFNLIRAEDRAGSTGRADHADGLGRLYNLLFTTCGALAKPAWWHQSRYLILDHVISMLEKEVDIASRDLLFAVSHMSLHGHLIALR